MSHRWKQAHDVRLAPLNMLKFSVWLSRGAGLVLSVDCTLVLLPMCRNLLRVIRPRIRWLPLDESKWFHRQVAYSLLFWTIVHTCSHYVKLVRVLRNTETLADRGQASSMSKDRKFARKQQWKFTTSRQVASPAT